MNSGWKCFWYTLLMMITFAVDRVTKVAALLSDAFEIKIAPFLSFDLVLNRGVSWGLFHGADDMVFKMVSLVTSGILVVLLGYTYYCWQRGELLVGHMLALSGGVANVYDRYLYGGVVDFIHFYWQGWSFPVFNVADICICIGIGIMLITAWPYHD